jgi:hypothetical protein
VAGSSALPSCGTSRIGRESQRRRILGDTGRGPDDAPKGHPLRDVESWSAGSVLASFMRLPRLLEKLRLSRRCPFTQRGSPLRNRTRGGGITTTDTHLLTTLVDRSALVILASGEAPTERIGD